MRTIYIPVIPWPNIVCKSTQKHCYQKIIHCIHNNRDSIQRSIKITSVLELFLQYQGMKINAKLRYKHFPGYISLNAVTFVISVRQINIIKVSTGLSHWLIRDEHTDQLPQFSWPSRPSAKIYRVGRGRGVLVSRASLYRNNCHILHDPV